MDVEVNDDVSDYEPTGRLIIDESAVVDSEDEEVSAKFSGPSFST